MPRYALRTDDAQQQIVDALRKAGVAVYVIGLPLDLLCAVRDPEAFQGYRTVLLEVKDEDGKLTKTQAEFLSEWPGETHVVRSPTEALNACFGKAMA